MEHLARAEEALSSLKLLVHLYQEGLPLDGSTVSEESVKLSSISYVSQPKNKSSSSIRDSKRSIDEEDKNIRNSQEKRSSQLKEKTGRSPPSKVGKEGTKRKSPLKYDGPERNPSVVKSYSPEASSNYSFASNSNSKDAIASYQAVGGEFSSENIIEQEDHLPPYDPENDEQNMDEFDERIQRLANSNSSTTSNKNERNSGSKPSRSGGASSQAFAGEFSSDNFIIQQNHLPPFNADIDAKDPDEFNERIQRLAKSSNSKSRTSPSGKSSASEKKNEVQLSLSDDTDPDLEVLKKHLMDNMSENSEEAAPLLISSPKSDSLKRGHWSEIEEDSNSALANDNSKEKHRLEIPLEEESSEFVLQSNQDSSVAFIDPVILEIPKGLSEEEQALSSEEV